MSQHATLPRDDYPRPQWKRAQWQNLNGTWQFAFDFSDSGEARKMYTDGEFPLEITVPFCPESNLSGIAFKDFIPAAWYRRTLHISQLPEGRALLHFGAVDHQCKVYVNGQLCGSHVGGYTAFTIDITDALHIGDNTLIVHARDDIRSGHQPRGKQSLLYESHDVSYTRTTGIWQTVWLELVPKRYLEKSKITPHACNGTIAVEVTGCNIAHGDTLRLTALYDGRNVGSVSVPFAGNQAVVELKVSEVHLWNPGAPELYDMTVELIAADGAVLDHVDSYFALRDVSFDKKGILINGKRVYMRLILDQGFHPDGLYTAPDEETLRRDIELAMDLGFNGARFHQRIFEPASLYWADKLGYPVWVEYGLGTSVGEAQGLEDLLPEWIEAVHQHYNYPSVIGWCPLNETYHYHPLDPMLHKLMYRVTKAMDSSRPVIDASGGVHFETDLYDVHDYEQDMEVLRAHLAPMLEDPNCRHVAFHDYTPHKHPDEYHGQAYWVSEYGGTFWNEEFAGVEGWGYGNVKTPEEFAQRYASLTQLLLSHPRVCGFCYTQLTDIEQEQNGLYYYNRERKLPDFVYDKIREVNTMIAAIEAEE